MKKNKMIRNNMKNDNLNYKNNMRIYFNKDKIIKIQNKQMNFQYLKNNHY